MSLPMDLVADAGQAKRGGVDDEMGSSKKRQKCFASTVTIGPGTAFGRYSYVRFPTAQGSYDDSCFFTRRSLLHWGSQVDHTQGGKWMAQFFGRNAEEFCRACWALALPHFDKGRLGEEMKALFQYNKSFICFYTEDHRDVADVLRVLVTLRTFCPVIRLDYKIDLRTLRGDYADTCCDGDLCFYHSPKNDTKTGCRADGPAGVVMLQNRHAKVNKLVVGDIVAAHLPLSLCVQAGGAVVPGVDLGFVYTSCAVGQGGVSFVGALL